MRRVPPRDFPLGNPVQKIFKFLGRPCGLGRGSAFNKALASLLSFAVTLGPTSAVAYDDDRYSYNPPRVQDYQNQYKPQNNFSPSFQLDRQISNQNAALLFKKNYATPGANFKTTDLPQDTFKPKILFQLALANPVKAPVSDLKAPQLAPPVTAKPGFLGAVQSLFKGIGAGFQKIGQAIGNAVQRMFTGTNKPGALSPQQKEIIGQYPNLQPTGPNTFTAVGKPTVAFGKVWEPGSTFTSKGKDLVLDQGVTLETSFGGIKDKTGGLLPVRMATVNGTITPVGLEFDRMRPNTTLQVSQPTAIDGFGTLHPGEMTYKGPIKDATDKTVGGRFNLQGMKVDLNRDTARQLGMDTSATLRQANFTLQAGLMRLTSAVLEQGNKRLFVQESKPPMDVQQLTKEIDSIGRQSGTSLKQLDSLSQSLDNRSLASTVLFNNLAQQTGGQDRIAFNFSNDYQALKKDSRAAQQQLANIQQAVEQEDFDRVSPEQVAEVGEKVKSLSSQVAALTEQSNSIANFQRGLSGMTAGLRDLAIGGADVRTIQGAEKLSEEELNRRTVLYFPEEKAEIQKQTDNALTALQAMVANGQMSPDMAGITALELLTIRDNAFAAKPNNVMAQAVNASYDAGAGLVDRAVDVMYFNQLNALAEMFPKTGEAVGTYMLVSFKGARTVSQAVGVGGLIYFGATAAASTGAMLATAYGVAKVAEKFGVDEAPAEVLGFMAAIGIGSFKPAQSGFQKWDVRIQDFLARKSSPLAATLNKHFSTGIRATPTPRGKVLRNIRESQLARQTSQFEFLPMQEKIFRAKAAQANPRYGGQDNFKIITLKKGQLVIGGFPGQTPWYTDIQTVKTSGLNQKSLFESLQVAPHPQRGYRPQLRVYRVMRDIQVPSGQALANPQFGNGGGIQYYIEDFAGLQTVREFNLK